jgi:D-glycero-alpha-D-manno-heptose-7-phosphate kinase
MTGSASRTLRIVNAVAPIRICDNGGWTDTWFAKHGKIFNIGVYPYAEVQVEVFPKDGTRPTVTIVAENFGERYALDPEKPSWDRHPLIEAAIKRMQLPDDLCYEVSIFSEAPSGASTGTSAAVSVALIGALDCVNRGHLTQQEVAYTAHAVETEMLGLQCGIQDQLCAALGGINFIEMTRYPEATVTPIRIGNPIWWELERRLVLIYLGKSHSSSQVHEKVIRELEDAGPECRQLKDLRGTAERSLTAITTGDFAALGRAMIDNTDAQANLNAALVSPDAAQVIDIAKSHGAVGWKVNGAGGDGGSLTLLTSGPSRQKRALIRAIEQTNPLFQSIPIYLSRQGLRTWEAIPQ